MKIIRRTLTPSPEPPLEYVLTLNRTEMLALSSITGYIGGEPKGPRAFFDELQTKIQKMGLPYYNPALRELGYQIDRTRQGIRFEEAP